MKFEFQFQGQVICKVIYFRNLSIKIFAVSLILTDASFLLWSINRFIFNSQILCYFIMVSYVVAVLERGIFRNGILVNEIFSFGIL